MSFSRSSKGTRGSARAVLMLVIMGLLAAVGVSQSAVASAAEPTDQKSVIFIGDSVTAGFG